MKQISDEMAATLGKLAARKCWSDDDDFQADDYAGGNFDDAYAGGVDDGEVGLARVILADIQKSVEA